MKKLLLVAFVGVILCGSGGGTSEAKMSARLEALIKDSLAQIQNANRSSSSSEVTMTTETEEKNLRKKKRRIDYGEDNHAMIESFRDIVSTRLLTEDDIEGLNNDELCLLNNLIYAINGYKFTQPRYRNFFEGYDWYTPTTSTPSLNSIEHANSKFIRKHMD